LQNSEKRLDDEQQHAELFRRRYGKVVRAQLYWPRLNIRYYHWRLLLAYQAAGVGSGGITAAKRRAWSASGRKRRIAGRQRKGMAYHGGDRRAAWHGGALRDRIAISAISIA